MGTVIVGIIVLAIAGGAAYSLHRDKKNGKSQCGGGCQPLWRTLSLNEN